MLEWRAQRLDRENKEDSDKTLYEVKDADTVTYIDDLSAFGIGKAAEDGG